MNNIKDVIKNLCKNSDDGERMNKTASVKEVLIEKAVTINPCYIIKKNNKLRD